MRVGLLFGSFNPIHVGHLVVARYWLNETDLSQIWLVVSPQNPHKRAESLAPIEERLTMARLATEGDPAIEVSDIELSLPRPSYTIRTLEALERQQADWEWILLVGSDAAATLPSWKEGETLLRRWPIWVYPRKDAPLEAVPAGAQIQIFSQAPRIDLSATQIRRYVQEGRSIRYLVPPPVEAYIHAQGLYRA